MYQIGDVMAEKNLLTLREIAVELGVKYKTIHHYKEIFEDFLAIQYQGRKIRYLPINVDLFAKILELKDEKYSNEAVYESLKFWRSNNLTFYLSDCRSDCASDYPSNHLSGGLSGGRSVHSSDCPSNELSGGPSDTASDTPGENSDTEHEQSSENNTWQIESYISQLQSDLESQLYAKLEQQINENVEQQIKEIVSNLENCLLNLKGQINGSITEFYKAICQLQDGMKYLEEKLSLLQQDLGVEQLDQIKFPELDLNNMQIDTPNIGVECHTDDAQEDNTTEDGLHADLEFVRNSIREGKPDKEAVIQWIHAQRNNDPPVSYGEMANMLNQEQIPTMKGKEGWNRGTVRNLAIRGNGEFN